MREILWCSAQWCSAGALVIGCLGLAGCGGSSSSAASPSTPPVLTQSTITLPSSVQVVSAK